MKTFRFEAARADGELVYGVLTAADATSALDSLARRKLTPVVITPASTNATRRRWPLRDMAILLRGLATLLSAGITLDEALRASRGSGAIDSLVDDLLRRIREGERFGDGLAAHPGVPGVVVGLVRSGEAAGLSEALERAAVHLEREADLTAKLRSALAYPCILLFVGSVAIATLLIGVLPRFVRLLGGSAVTLPASTRLLLGLGAFLNKGWLLVLVGAFAMAVAGAQWLRSESGHRTLLAIPVVGDLRLALATSRVSRTLAALLGRGTPALIALAAAAEASGDLVIRGRILKATEAIRRGESLSQALASFQALSAQAIQLLRIGEDSGRVPDFLDRAAALAEEYAARTLNSAVRLLEPSLIVLFGAVIALVAAAMLQAVYGLRVG
ncbi:MAG: type II secretion system F family protein [Gemmatimonadetes bacterium]|nr:type II secretion system F family protein [Gemmatimonadota bacterium]